MSIQSHPDNLPPTEDPDPPWAKETWVNKEDYITESPIRLFTDIFKEKPLPEEVEKVLDSPNFQSLSRSERVELVSTPEGRTSFALHMANYYKLAEKEDRYGIKIYMIAIGVCILFIGVAALVRYLF